MKPEFLAELIDKFFDAAIAPFAARLAALESRPAPQDGKSVTVEEFRGLLTDIVDDRLNALPKPKDGEDGKSVTLEDVRPLVAELVEQHVKALPASPAAKGFDPGDFDRFADLFLRRLDEPLAQ
ncbi:MAG TPA: hypothetical protein PLB26_17155 [Rubrivivax sp.]|nr:hypothetical protein [Rubrivivax sp.]